MRSAECFERSYRQPPEAVSFAPYRVCPLGAHVDHNLGKVTGFAIDRGVHIAYAPACGDEIEVRSLQFPGMGRWRIAGVPPERQNDWADHLRGATIALGRRAPLSVGMRAVIDGELPIGGLSSSAAVIIAFVSALCAVNGIRLEDGELIDVALEAENRYVGVSCGRLDQSCEVYCKKDHLLFLDLKDGLFERIPPNPGMKPFEIAVFFSGLDRSLVNSGYNARVDELRAAAYALRAYAGLENGKFGETNMRSVPPGVFERYAGRLPDDWRARAEHWFSELDRVEKGVQAWRAGDIAGFGQLSFASGRSSIDKWRTGSPEMIRLYEIMTHTDGIYGGRFSGAGIRGCCVALIDPAMEEEVARAVEREYLSAFPRLAGKYSAHFCHSADGVGR